jgi:hypothetical protein
LSARISLKAGGYSANTKRSVLPVKKYLTGYKTAQKLSCFVACQLSREELHISLSVCGRPTGFQRDPCTQIFPEFYLSYLKLYLNCFEIDQLSHWQHYMHVIT